MNGDFVYKYSIASAQQWTTFRLTMLIQNLPLQIVNIKIFHLFFNIMFKDIYIKFEFFHIVLISLKETWSILIEIYNDINFTLSVPLKYNEQYKSLSNTVD